MSDFIRSPKIIILIDLLGALLSAFVLGIVLVRFENETGMPVKALYVLAGVPCFFALYDLSILFFRKKNLGDAFGTLGSLNIGYCAASGVLLIYHFDRLTTLGISYFCIEIVIVLMLGLYELRVSTLLN